MAADLWSVTSWNGLARDALDASEHHFTHPDEPPPDAVGHPTSPATGPVIATSDLMRAVPQQIAEWVPAQYVTLGTDGYGFSDTREAGRRFFRVDAESVTARALRALADEGTIEEDRDIRPRPVRPRRRCGRRGKVVHAIDHQRHEPAQHDRRDGARTPPRRLVPSCRQLRASRISASWLSCSILKLDSAERILSAVSLRWTMLVRLRAVVDAGLELLATVVQRF